VKRTPLNLLIDTLALFVAGALVGTGLLLAYRLPPGRGGHGLAILGWSRHEWGDLHLILAWIVIGLVVVHLLLHLDWLAHACSDIGARCGALGRRWVLPLILLAATAAIVAAPMLLPIRQVAQAAAISTPVWEVFPGMRSESATGPTVRLADGRQVEIRGNTTLSEIASLTGLSDLPLRCALGVAADQPGSVSLKAIASELGLAMPEVRERIQTALDGTHPIPPPSTGVSP
jgi:hypothetical protein